MKTFTIRINCLVKDSEELYLKFCNRYFYNVQMLEAHQRHTVNREDVTVIFVRDEKDGRRYDGYITLLPKDAEASKPAPDNSQHAPLVCIGSSRVQYVGDVSGHSHIRIEEDYPADLFSWLVKILNNESDLDTYNRVLTASAGLLKLGQDAEFLRNIEASLNDYITKLSLENCRTVAICNDLTTTVRHHGAWRTAPEAFHDMRARIKQDRRFTIWIDGEFIAIRIKWPAVEDPSASQ